MAARHLLDESPVKGRVVGQDGVAAYEVSQCSHGFLRTRSIPHVQVCDVRQHLDFRRNGARGIHEGLEPVHYLTARDARGRNLYELAFLEGEARRLGIQYDHILFKKTEIGVSRLLLKAVIHF